MHRISVIMPSHNQGQFIREAIDSVLSQEIGDLEFIVMDGGSDDGTVEILRSYGDRLTFSSGPDDGQSWAINEGMRRSTGSIVCWLNSDDAFLPGALELVLDTFAADPQVEFVTGAGRNIAEDGSLIGDVGAQPARTWEFIHHRNFFTQPSCFMRRELWFDVGGLDESLDYVLDWDLWIRCGCAKSAFLTQQLSDNRTYGRNKSNSGGVARLREIERMVSQYTLVSSPPVLELYGIETTIKDPETSFEQAAELSQQFMAGMSERISGISDRGAFARSFSFAVTPRRSGDAIGAEFSSVGRYLSKSDFASEVLLEWSCESRGSGEFRLGPEADSHTLIFPFTLEMGEVVAVDVKVSGEGFTPIGRQEILGYFDRAGSKI